MDTSLIPKLQHITCPHPDGQHQMAYWEWGNPQADHVVMCVHGLSRQGRDFDVLAMAIVDRWGDAVKVICPDVVGRGNSTWLSNPTLYQLPVYASDMMTLLAGLNPRRIDWVGTSMGGLIGMALAGQPVWPLTKRMGHLVLNDVGPVVEWAALERIAGYLGRYGVFSTPQAAADYLLSLSSGFGPHSPEQWMGLCLPMLRPLPSGWTLHYDPAIAQPLASMTPESAEQGQQALWHLYDQIKANTLVLRGAQSDLLTSSTALQMTQRGPCAKIHEFEGVGHAPTLIAPDQVKVVLDFLEVN